MSLSGSIRTMMSRSAPASAVKLLALFVVLSGIPLAALGWLGWRVMQQDRAIEAQRLRERLENAASLVTVELDRGLAAWEELLPSAAAGQAVTLPPRAVFLLLDADGVIQQQGATLPYYPHVRSTSSASLPLFDDAERQEFRQGNLTAAISAYRELASSANQLVRAEALMRLARCLRKQGQTGDALAVYDRLTALGDVMVAGSPAELVARRERIVLLQGVGDLEASARERGLLTAALASGRFRIDQPTFEYFSELTSTPDATPLPEAGPSLPLALAVEALWPAWLEQPNGRRAVTGDAAVFLSVWRRTPAGIAALMADIDALTASTGSTLRSLHASAELVDPAGKRLWGNVPAGPRVTRTTREIGLPWTLHVAESAPLASMADSRLNVFLAGFVLMALVVAAASYFVFRAVTRELGVARLQSDFVAAVSHEFRTPLTAMCHLTEMLERGDASPERLPEYYRALGKESRRLHTMVESLLDFGRMDSGRRTYDFAETEAVELVARVAQEFAERSPAAAARIERALPASGGDTLVIRVDREAFALALRNLLDNAMKYSPDSSPIQLAVARHDGTVAISVADHGAGISPWERREIFRKFTRGEAARSLNVKGTGIGLTMAGQIVEAHGGQVTLESEPGQGSTFTIVLPLAATERL